MTTLTSNGILGWPAQAQAWLDERGKPAWIAATVLGFIFFWPVGLALLAYAIWSKRMFNRSHSCGGHRMHRMDRYAGAYASSGNSAFDAYKAETLRRLEDEQQGVRELPAASARRQGQAGVRRLHGGPRPRGADAPGGRPA